MIFYIPGSWIEFYFVFSLFKFFDDRLWCDTLTEPKIKKHLLYGMYRSRKKPHRSITISFFSHHSYSSAYVLHADTRNAINFSIITKNNYSKNLIMRLILWIINASYHPVYRIYLNYIGKVWIFTIIRSIRVYLRIGELHNNNNNDNNIWNE